MIRPVGNPAKPFTILEPRDQEISGFCVVHERTSSDGF